MWIGTPGAMRHIADGAVSYDRTPQLSVSEFRSLAGGVTTWRAPLTPRRLKVTWGYMQREDFDHIDRLAREVDGPRTLVVLDPLSDNLLMARQSLGMGAVGKWVSDEGVSLFGGQSSEYNVNQVSANAASLRLMWTHPVWVGYPVTPGMRIQWFAPDLSTAGALSGLRFAYYNAAGEAAGAISTVVPDAPLYDTVPPGAAFVRPGVIFGSAGTWSLGRSVLAADTYPAGEPPLGQDVSPVSITAYNHAGSSGNGQYRDITLEMVEVTNA